MSGCLLQLNGHFRSPRASGDAHFHLLPADEVIE